MPGTYGSGGSTTPGSPAPGTATNTSGVSALDFIGQKEMNLPVILTNPGYPGDPSARRDNPDFAGTGGKTTVGGALGLLSTMDPNTLTQLQQSLYAGHFYSSTYYGKTHPPIRGGEPDDATISAYTRALRIAARNHQPLDQIIKSGDTAANDITGSGTSGTLGAAAPPIPGADVRTTDPARLQILADTAAESILGRKATDSERKRVADAITAKESSNQLTQQTAKYDDKLNTYVNAHPGGALGPGGPLPGSGTPETKAVIVRVANELGVDPKLALAIAEHESGQNPNEATGDGGHSIGLFQLNDQGEGAGMTVAQRQNPEVNARIALSEVAAVAKAHPNWSPGQIAAAAQRPADRAAYERSINAVYGGGSAPTAVGQYAPGQGPAAAQFAATGTAPALGSGRDPDTFTTTVDPQAQAEVQTRAMNPGEAGANDLAGQFATFMQLIGVKP